MRLAVISHSNVAERQRRFWHKLSSYFKDLEVYELYPEKWGLHTRKGGWKVLNEGSIYEYDFPGEAWLDMELNGKPDVVYVQAEVMARVTHKALDMTMSMDCAKALFVWENHVKYSPSEKKLLENFDLVVCGNTEAQMLVDGSGAGVETCVLPQVGIDFDLFQAVPEEPKWDFAFMGRNDPMKGGEILWKAMTGITDGKLYWHDREAPVDYEELPYVYCRAKYHVAPSINVPGRPREQFAPAVNVEALACERHIITTSLAAIHEWLDDIPGVEFVSPDNIVELHNALEVALKKEWTPNTEGRAKANERFSIDAVGKNLIPRLEAIVH